MRNNSLKLSKLTDYATVILSLMAKDETRRFNATDIAQQTGIALPTVSKLLKILQKAEILVSVRGVKGGYSLARSPAKISLATIINVLEGPIALTECNESHRGCEQAHGCRIQGNWHLINQRVHLALESVTLADMILPARQPQEFVIPVTSLYR